MIPTIFGGDTGRTYEDLKRQQELANVLARSRSGRAPRNVGEGLNAIGQAIAYRNMTKKNSDLSAQLQGDMQGQWADIFNNNMPAAQPTAGNFNPQADTMGLDTGSSQPPGYAGQGVTIGDRTYDMGRPAGGELARGIIETAKAIGADPLDLATAISYETGGTFDPKQAGPTTQWGQHRGLIQFGEPQAKQHGVDWDNPLQSQLGSDGAIASYMRSSGFQPGMGMLDLYSTINAGAPGRYGASDANNGGAPGNVQDKVEQQMAGHRQKAMELLGMSQPNVSTKGSTDLGMIGGVKPDGSAWQSLTGQGRAHASNPDYEDYSQLFREYRFDPPSNDWMPVGERQGRTVYAAPDYARDAQGNYINVSAAEAEQMAQARGSLIPTREEYTNLFNNGTRVPMPTGDPATKTSAQYTQGTQSLIDQMGIDPSSTLVHGKEFFTGEPTQVASTDPQAQMLAASLTGQSSQPQLPGNDQMAFNMPESQLTSPLQMPATTPQPVQPQMQPQVSTQNQSNLQSEFQRVQQQASQVQQMMLQPGWKEMASPAMKAQAAQVLEQYKMLSQQVARQSDPRYQMQLQRDALEIQRLQRELSEEPETFNMLSSQEVQQMGLPPGSYQRSSDGRVYPVSPQTTTIENTITTGGETGRYLYGTDAGLPAGWRIDRQTGQASVIPGGPADVEQQDLDTKSTERDRQQTIKMGTTLTNLQMNIDEIQNGGFPVTGPLGAISGMVPGTSASDWRVRNEQIVTEGALAEIQNMRDNSPTGGAVGQLTDSERKAIALAATGISNAQSAEEYVRAAENYRQVMLDTAYGAGKWRLDGAGGVTLSVGDAKPQTENPYMGMSDEDFGNIDLDSLTPEQLDQLYEARGL